MSRGLHQNAQRVQDALERLGFPFRVVELPQSTRTAVEAAQAIGCEVGQIVKSLVFRGKRGGRPLLIVVSGANRVNETSVAGLIGEPIEKADADFVREQTGYVIGGVPPVGHLAPMETLIDEDLMQYEEVWAAAGAPHAVFCLSPKDLARMSGGRVARVK